MNHPSKPVRYFMQKLRGIAMTFQARFTVVDIAPVSGAAVDVIAAASVEHGSLTQNTEHASAMEIRIRIDAGETALQVGDEITVTGHFNGAYPREVSRSSETGQFVSHDEAAANPSTTQTETVD